MILNGLASIHHLTLDSFIEVLREPIIFLLDLKSQLSSVAEDEDLQGFWVILKLMQSGEDEHCCLSHA